MSPPRVSCLLPVYNGAEFLEQAINSVRAQTFEDFEIIVVDDGSTDETPQVLSRLADMEPRLRVVRQANGGIVSALNAGLQRCRGEFVARMDADDMALPERFATQVAYLDAHPSCVLVGGVAVETAVDGRVMSRTTGGRHAVTDLGVFPPRIAVSMHPLITVRRAALEAVGGYRGDFPHAEDYDLFIRLARLGTIDNPPVDVLIYRRHEGAISIKHLETQERSAALAEVEACRAYRRSVGLSETIPQLVLEPYVRLRIMRRYFSVAPSKALSLAPAVVGDMLNLTPRALASSDYWALRLRMAGAFARVLAGRVRRKKIR